MKTIFTSVLCIMLTSIAALGQDSMTKDTSGIFTVELSDGTILTGKIGERNNSEMIFSDLNLGKIQIPLKNIRNIKRMEDNPYCLITLVDGSTYHGLLLSRNEAEVVMKTDNIGVITVPLAKVRELRVIKKSQIINGRYYFPNPHPTRYYFAPSAIPLSKREGYYLNAYILCNGVQFGLSDNFSLGGGVVVPLGFFITPKIGFKLARNIYVGGGILFASSFVTNTSLGLGVGYGVLTLGNKEHNFTIGSGYGVIKSSFGEYNYKSEYEWVESKRPLFTINAMTRLARKLSLVTENWIYPERSTVYSPVSNSPASYSYSYRAVVSFGFRIMGEKNSFDAAMLMIRSQDKYISIPYAGYCLRF